MSVASKQAARFKAQENGAKQNVHTAFEIGHPGNGNAKEGDLEFAAEYFEEQEREKRHRAYIDYAPQFAREVRDVAQKDQKGASVQVNVSPPEAAIDIYMQKEEEAALAAYEYWIGAKYLNLYSGDGKGPDLASQKLVRELFPDYFERRLAQINRNTEIQKKAAKIKLFGAPRTPEELEFQYMLETGQIEIPTTLPFETGTVVKSTANSKRGVFNVLNWNRPDESAQGQWGKAGWERQAPNTNVSGYATPWKGYGAVQDNAKYAALPRAQQFQNSGPAWRQSFG